MPNNVPKPEKSTHVKGGSGAHRSSGLVSNSRASGAHEATRHVKDEFIRAPHEDDDGYDPYSDRRPEPAPLFERDPWN